MSKDRAAPFSRKHRRYWIPVTGGMILIGILNVALGFCSYTPPKGPPARIIPVLPPPDLPDASIDAPGSLDLAELPAPVMRAFAVKYPRIIPAAAFQSPGPEGIRYTLTFPPEHTYHHATFRADGTFVSQD